MLNVADPLGGSWYVEALTDKLEAEAEAIFARIKDLGGDGTMTSGLLRGIEDGWFIGEIADSAFAYQVALEKGDKRVVGVNTLTGDVGDELEILRVSHEVELEQRAVRRRAPRRPRPGRRRRRAGADGRRRRGRPQHRAGDARRGARRGDPRRDLQRVQADVGRVPRAGPLLTCCAGHAAAAVVPPRAVSEHTLRIRLASGHSDAGHGRSGDRRAGLRRRRSGPLRRPRRRARWAVRELARQGRRARPARTRRRPSAGPSAGTPAEAPRAGRPAPRPRRGPSRSAPPGWRGRSPAPPRRRPTARSG